MQQQLSLDLFICSQFEFKLYELEHLLPILNHLIAIVDFRSDLLPEYGDEEVAMGGAYRGCGTKRRSEV